MRWLSDIHQIVDVWREHRIIHAPGLLECSEAPASGVIR